MNKLYDVVVIRSIAIVMVVAYHAYGMMYWDGHFPETAERYKDLYFVINQYILNFRMPLFLFISGLLFSFLETEKCKYPTFTALAKNKFKRLIIPYLIFATIYMLTTGMGFNLKIMLSGWLAHLWFIATLFWCFISTRLSCFIPYSKTLWFKCTLLAISFILLFPELPKIGFLGIQELPEWFFWFYLGYVISPYREQLFIYMSKRKIWLLALTAVYSFGLVYTITFTGNEEESSWFIYPGQVSIVLLVWYITNYVIRNSSKAWYKNRIFGELNRTSYGIYVLHYWLQVLIVSSSVKQVLHLDELAANHIYAFPLILFLATLLMSYVGTRILLKTSVGRFLIG